MRIKKLFTLVLIIIVLLVSISGCKDKGNEEALSRTEFLMDTVITLKIYDKDDKEALDEAIDRLKDIEQKTSSFIEDSEVNRINDRAGIEAVKVSQDLHYIIEEAKYFAQISQGAYEPTIGPLVDLWDIRGAEEEERDSIPTEEEIREKMELVDYNDLEIMDDRRIYLKRKGMKLDLGGIVKGYAADEVKRIFNEHDIQSAIIDLGGNVYVIGNKSHGEPWKIGIQDPHDTIGNYLGILKTEERSIVTSGDYERYFKYKGIKYHHIIDAKTGYPSEKDVSGVSIISPKSIDGDALSTALFVLGPEDGMKLLEQMKDIEAIFIDRNGKVLLSKGLEDVFTFSH